MWHAVDNAVTSQIARFPIPLVIYRDLFIIIQKTVIWSYLSSPNLILTIVKYYFELLINLTRSAFFFFLLFGDSNIG